MTGYGRGESSRNGFKITVELSSVNRRQTEVSLALPDELEPLEGRIREEVQRQVARGRVTVRIAMALIDDPGACRVRLNRALAAAYAKELAALAHHLDIPAAVSLDSLLRLPGVLQPLDAGAHAESRWPAVEAALGQALERLQRTRRREGQHLAADLKARISAMRRLVSQIERQAPRTVEKYRCDLLERIRQAGVPLAADDERLLKEVVVFADRADITEELTRLRSHFKQFDAALVSREPVGRLLDFLAQEMNREINTLGSKANDAAISHAVVRLKTELDKFREQVQNLE